MKLLLLGDAHLIAEADPYKGLHRVRGFFKDAWPSFRDLLRQANDEAPDLTIMLGDLVDWFSEENIDFGLDLLSTLDQAWAMVPGNHDLERPVGGYDQTHYENESTRDRMDYWRSLGVDLSTRTLDVDGYNLVLLDDSLSNLADGTAAALPKLLPPDRRSLLLAHVPLDTPLIREYIVSVAPDRNLRKYVLSGAPDLYQTAISGRVSDVFTAHLHFPGLLTDGSTRFHLQGLSTSIHDPNRNQTTVAEALVVQGGAHGVNRRVVSVD